MKVDKVVRKETINIAIGILVCSAITQIVFLLLGRFSLAVFLGSLYGGLIALLNFFFMGLTVQKVTRMEDKNMAKRRMQASYSMRQLGLLLAVGVGMYVSVQFKILHWLPILLAIVYPRITIAIFGLFRKEWVSKGGEIE